MCTLKLSNDHRRNHHGGITIKRFARIFLVSLFFLSLTVPCRSADQKQALPFFESAECMFSVKGENSRCGYVYVPEDRSNPNSPVIKLTVKLYKSTSPNPKPDPIVFLQGGPGSPSLMMHAARKFDSMIAPYLAERDFIIFDQRGSGFSEPSLYCNESAAFVEQAQNFYTYKDIAPTMIDVMSKCRARLTAQGIRLESYNSIENAADVDAIRQALGIDQWNLMGVSYGSRLALSVMRYHPEHVRSVVIGSIDPPNSKYHWGIADSERLFKDLFERCESDPACNAGYPNLEDIFFKAIEKYNAKPLRLVIKDPFPGSAIDGKTIHWNFTGGQVSGILYGEMYSAELIAKAPGLIYAMYRGDMDIIKKLVSRNILMAPAYLNFVHLLAIDCMDKYAFETRQSMQAAYDFHARSGGLEWARSMTYGRFVVDLCDALVDTNQIDPNFQSPVISDLPTLILNGDLDSATPPDYAIIAAATLKNSQLFILNGVGHSPLVEGQCPIDMVKQFLKAPMKKVDASCMVGAFPGVKFELPDDSGNDKSQTTNHKIINNK